MIKEQQLKPFQNVKIYFKFYYFFNFIVAIIRKRKNQDAKPKKIVFISEKDELPEKENDSLFFIRINSENNDSDEEIEENEAEESNKEKSLNIFLS